MIILFEDESLVVCVKPVGTLSESSVKADGMPDLLARQTGSKIYTVHRLDRGVGGVMVYAKTEKAAASLSLQIANRSFVKEYYAAVNGIPEEKSATLDDLLFKDSSRNKTFVVKRMRRGVKPASLSYEVISSGTFSGREVTAVNVLLHTGRSHQIRVQFASRKHPLIGDGKYGARDNEKNISLWCHRLSFLHPDSGETAEFSAEPPEDTLLFRLIGEK